jgi:hypothetical protein
MNTSPENVVIVHSSTSVRDSWLKKHFPVRRGDKNVPGFYHVRGGHLGVHLEKVTIYPKTAALRQKAQSLKAAATS